MMKKRIIALLLTVLILLPTLGACMSPIDFITDALSTDKDLTDLEINNITRECVKSTVMINVRGEKHLYGTPYYYNTTGSGVIFMQDDTSLYILTCAHVLMPEDRVSILSIDVKDYKYRSYSALMVAIDDSYDLAVIKITKDYHDYLSPIPMAQKEVRIGDAVAAVSSPDGQINALTVGNVTDISTPQNASGDAINLGFDVICHNTWLTNGSSGSVLFNSEGKIVGINYAVTRTSEGEHIESYAVPVGKIMEFLKKYSLN